MLNELLLSLRTRLRAEGLEPTPGQWAEASRYALASDTLTPDPGLEPALKPILVRSPAEAVAYHRAWTALRGAKAKAKKGKKKPKKISPSGGAGLGDSAGQGSGSSQSTRQAQPPLSATRWQPPPQQHDHPPSPSCSHPTAEDTPTPPKSTASTPPSTRQDDVSRQQQALAIRAAPQAGEQRQAGLRDALRRPLSEVVRDEKLLTDVLRYLTQRLRVRLRRRRQSGGSIDLARTLRSSYRTLGEPMRLIRRRAHRQPARWVVLADISGSMSHALRLGMPLLLELRRLLRTELTVYAFVADTIAVDHSLYSNDARSAVQALLRPEGLNRLAHSDYGSALRRFAELTAPDRRTVLLVIGDARSNFRHPGNDILANYRGRCRRVLWFNPEPEEEWDTGDSVMGEFRLAVDGAFAIDTPEALIQALEAVV